MTLVIAASSCGGDETAETLPDPRPPGPDVPPPADPFAKLPEPRYLDQEPPACCPHLLGGWQHPYTVFPGAKVSGTLSSPGPGPDPQRVEVNADVVFRVSRVTARGERLSVVNERRVYVEAVEAFHKRYLTVRLRDRPPAYYALELELHPNDGPTERYVSYAYLAPRGRPAVELTLDQTSARAGETLRLTVHNRGTARLEYGLAYRLERRIGPLWRWINRDAAFALILLVAEPGSREREEIRLPPDLEPGRYRIVKSFTARPGPREIEAAVEFEVR